jgi:hypothetical protein
MAKDTHLPVGICFLDSVVAEDLFQLERILGQGNVVGLGIPFLETPELVTVAQLPVVSVLGEVPGGNGLTGQVKSHR